MELRSLARMRGRRIWRFRLRSGPVRQKPHPDRATAIDRNNLQVEGSVHEESAIVDTIRINGNSASMVYDRAISRVSRASG